MVEFWDYEKMTVEVLNSLRENYQFKVKKVLFYGIEWENADIIVSIRYRLQEFVFSVTNIRNESEIELINLILRKYPNYFQKDSKDVVFELDKENFQDNKLYFQYLVKTSFDFIQTNFPEVLQGKF